LAITLAREDDAFSIRDIGTLLDVRDAEVAVTGSRVESLEVGMIGMKGPDG